MCVCCCAAQGLCCVDLPIQGIWAQIGISSWAGFGARFFIPQHVYQRDHLRSSASCRFCADVGSSALEPPSPRRHVDHPCGRPARKRPLRLAEEGSHGGTSCVPVCAVPPRASGSLCGFAAKSLESGPGIVSVVALPEFESPSRLPGVCATIVDQCGYGVGLRLWLWSSTGTIFDHNHGLRKKTRGAAFSGAGSLGGRFANHSVRFLRDRPAHGIGLRQQAPEPRPAHVSVVAQPEFEPFSCFPASAPHCSTSVGAAMFPPKPRRSFS